MNTLVADAITPGCGFHSPSQLMHYIGTSARAAAQVLAEATTHAKNKALRQAVALCDV